jgi:amidase
MLARMDDGLARMDACAQSELVRRREVSPTELVEAAIRRIERLEPELGTLAAQTFEAAADRLSAGARARAPKGVLHGVPFLMKDVGAAQQGQPYYAGNRVLRDMDHRARGDSLLGSLFRQSGLATVGVSRAPEFGMQSTTQPMAFGPTRNPWSPDRSAGGSSGGACAAVAAGLVPLAHANDGAGSIRIPAAWCGIVGLKPTRGRIPTPRGHGAASSAEFVVSRSVRDTALLLDVLTRSPLPVGLQHLPTPERSYRAELECDPGRLRIGLCIRMPRVSVHPECAKAAEETAHALENLGHEVILESPRALHDEERGFCGLALVSAGYRACLSSLATMLGREVTQDDVEPFLWTFADPHGPDATPAQMRWAMSWLRLWSRRIESWWEEGFDLLVTPTVAEPACSLEHLDPHAHDPMVLLERMAPHMAFTEPFNCTGQPALSLPLHWSSEGLPLGVQLVAARGREDLLLRVAAQLEQIFPWADRSPVCHA